MKSMSGVVWKRHLARWLTPLFYMLAPEVQGDHAGYGLFVEWAGGKAIGAGHLKELVRLVESGLQENFHYRYCRQLGQLGPVRVFGIDGAQTPGMTVYDRVCRESGQREGNIKLYALHNRPGWAEQFAGQWLDPQEEVQR
ncbi:MAG TPA: hypothetical protein VHR86_00130 [Armatimonadota bacterium]|nr:hypothetical protein [Armatimonadota bacterium]